MAAILGAYAITWPWARIHTLVFFFYFFTVVDVPAIGVLGCWFLIQLIEGQRGGGGGVAWWSHIGGFVVGLIIMPILCDLLGDDTQQKDNFEHSEGTKTE